MASISRPPQGLFDTAKALIKEQHHTPTESDGEHPQDPPVAHRSQLVDGAANGHPPSQETSPPKPHSPRLSSIASGRRSMGTPSGRTGPPRSISYNYSLSGSHPASRANSPDEHDEHERVYPHIELPEGEFEDPDLSGEFPPATTPFRGVLEVEEAAEKKGKKRESYFYDVLSPRKWISESPKVEHTSFNLQGHSAGEGVQPLVEEPEAEDEPEEQGSEVPDRIRHARSPTTQSPSSGTPSSRFASFRRTRSLPHLKKEDGKSATAPRWNRLRSFIPHLAAQGREQNGKAPSAVVSQSVNITDELLVGGLSTLMLKLWFERDEKDDRRVPILLHRLRIRVSDSLHPLHGHKAVFRIECEYANGAARWVVYRQLREFLSLHTHYTLSNAYNRNIEDLPDFPRAGKYPFHAYPRTKIDRYLQVYLISTS